MKRSIGPETIQNQKAQLKEDYLFEKNILWTHIQNKRALHNYYQSLPDTGGPEDWIKIVYWADADTLWETKWKELKDKYRTKLQFLERSHAREAEQQAETWERQRMKQEDLAQTPERLQARLEAMIE